MVEILGKGMLQIEGTILERREGNAGKEKGESWEGGRRMLGRREGKAGKGGGGMPAVTLADGRREVLS